MVCKDQGGISSKITKAVAGKKVRWMREVLDNLEDALISADVGVETTVRIIEQIEQQVAKDKYLSTSELNNMLQQDRKTFWLTLLRPQVILLRVRCLPNLISFGSGCKWGGKNYNYWQTCT